MNPQQPEWHPTVYDTGKKELQQQQRSRNQQRVTESYDDN